MSEMFKTPCPFVSGFIELTTKTTTTFHYENNNTYYCYPLTEEIKEALVSYHNGGMIDAYLFTAVVKRNKSKYLSAKGNR
jgi:hypothetical protein